MSDLIYTGAGFVPGVPARDLTDAEVKQFGGEAALIRSGAYRLDVPEPKAAPKKNLKNEE